MCKAFLSAGKIYNIIIMATVKFPGQELVLLFGNQKELKQRDYVI